MRRLVFITTVIRDSLCEPASTSNGGTSHRVSVLPGTSMAIARHRLDLLTRTDTLSIRESGVKILRARIHGEAERLLQTRRAASMVRRMVFPVETHSRISWTRTRRLRL